MVTKIEENPIMMTTTPHKLLPLALLALPLLIGMAPSAQADVIALYTFTSDSLDSTDSESNSTANAFVAGSGVTAQFYSGHDTTNTTSGADAYQGVGNLSSWTASLDPTKYFSFTVEADAGYNLNLTSLSFFTSKNNNGVDTWEVRSSQDFNSTIDSGTGVYQGSPGTGTWTNPSVSLSLNNVTGPLEFRIYGYNGNTGNFRLDDVTLNGSVSAIPEPSTWLLITSGLGALYMLRRRR
jgi:hypothetical protein